ncbi:MAG: VanW family protein, partial [Lachnospiraceae bacterium]|nr:VanW family protein [Lachnospiraceae bacterium]
DIDIPGADTGEGGSLQGQAGRMGDPPLQVTGTPEVKLLTSEFSTWYGSSGPERCGNIERAVQLLNGTVIAPGEVFSCAAAIGPITEENGYLPAGTFVQGKVEKGIGGGVCQVSTTLYNAALLSGLTIVERSPHSMAVGYVDPARDAAIAGNYKDLKLRNDYAYPVVIEALTEDGMLYFRIHTSEEDLGNKIELVSVVLEEIPPGPPIITIDETLPKDSYTVTQKAHIGYVAELYRVITRNDIEILREKINTSSYAATPEYATAGVDFR